MAADLHFTGIDGLSSGYLARFRTLVEVIKGAPQTGITLAAALKKGGCSTEYLQHLSSKVRPKGISRKDWRLIEIIRSDDKKICRLTKYGEVLYEFAQALEPLAQKASQRLKNAETIVIAATRAALDQFVTPAIDKYFLASNEEHRHVHFQVKAGIGDSIAIRVRDGAADVGISYGGGPDRGLDVKRILKTTIKLLHHRDNEMPERVELQTISGRVYLLTEENPIRCKVERYLNREACNFITMPSFSDIVRAIHEHKKGVAFRLDKLGVFPESLLNKEIIWKEHEGELTLCRYLREGWDNKYQENVKRFVHLLDELMDDVAGKFPNSEPVVRELEPKNLD